MTFNESVSNQNAIILKTVRSFVLLVGLLLSREGLTQTHMVGGYNNIYSPHMEFVAGRLKMYFGGWKDGWQVRDAIYRADCWHPHLQCNDEGPVRFWDQDRWSEVPRQYQAINDPTIVNMGSYLIMYFTICPINVDCGTYPWAHQIHYATSWSNDGMYWSTPQPLLYNYWLPSVTRNAAGEVILYANEGWGGRAHVFNLTGAGIYPVSDQWMNANNGTTYINSEVRYQPSIGLYQMVGEPLGGHNGIDYLVSWDGVNFYAVRNYITGPVWHWGHIKARTPAMHPHTASWLYFGSTYDSSGMQNQIFFTWW